MKACPSVALGKGEGTLLELCGASKPLAVLKTVAARGNRVSVPAGEPSLVSPPTIIPAHDLADMETFRADAR